MASMNLLGFSLSPQEHPSTQDHSQTVASRFGFNPDNGISGTDVPSECFDLTSDHHSSAHSLNLPPFGFYEAFQRNTTNNIHTTQGFFHQNLTSLHYLILSYIQ